MESLKNYLRKKALLIGSGISFAIEIMLVQKVCILCMAALVSGGGLWMLCVHDTSEEDGISAVQDEIEKTLLK